MEDKSVEKISISKGNILYLVCMLLFIGVGSIVQKISFNYGILITEFILIALPPIIYVKAKKGSIRKEFRFNKLHIIDALLVILVFVFGYFVAAFINTIGNIIVSLFGQLPPSPVPIPQNINEFIVLTLIVAGSAGLCEEILFRGFVLRAYEKTGIWTSINVTAVLFAIMHLNVQNFLGPLFLGILLGYVVYKTDSIFAGMLGHFVNNAMSLTIGYAVMKLQTKININPELANASITTPALIGAAILFGIIAFVTGILMILPLYGIHKRSKVRQDTFSEIKLGNILKNIRISWPIYVGSALFLILSVLEIIYISTGKSIFELFK